MCNLDEYIKYYPYDKMSEKIIDQVYKQINEGLTIMHNELNIIHGDIKPQNILIRGKNKQYEIYEDKMREIDIDSLNKLFLDNKKTCKFIGTELNKIKKNERITYDENIDICICDFSISRNNKEYPKIGKICTVMYRPIENILYDTYSYATDIWSFGCLLFELICMIELFNVKKDDDNEILELHNKYLGEISNTRLHFSKKNIKKFKSETDLNYIKNHIRDNLSEEYFNKYYNLIKSMLDYNTKTRLTLLK